MKDKPVILVVDDQPQNIELLEAHFVPHGYEIVKAANGEEPLGKLSGNQIDLILLDVMMPVMDGYTATREVRRWEKENQKGAIPIITLTAHAMKEDEQKSLEAGCPAHVTKPIKKAILIETIQKYMKRKE